MAKRAERSKSGEKYEAIKQDAKKGMRQELSSEDQLEPSLEELEDLETALGMEEVDLDQAVIDTVAADDTDDNLDADDDGIVDETDDEEIVDNRPQELTESYGTGLQGRPSDRAGRYSRRSDNLDNEGDPILTAGDVDANYEQASVVGDEAVGGTAPTPDQDIVDEVAAAVGVEMNDRSFLRMGDMLDQRDDQRWELDPKSSEDYADRRNDQGERD